MPTAETISITLENLASTESKMNNDAVRTAIIPTNIIAMLNELRLLVSIIFCNNRWTNTPDRNMITGTTKYLNMLLINLGCLLSPIRFDLDQKPCVYSIPLFVYL